MTIAAILDDKGHEVTTIDPGMRMREAVALLASRRIGALPVVQDDAVLGVISERDVLYGLAAEGAALLDRMVADVMTRDPVTVTPEMPALAALSLVTQRRIRHLPVVADGRLIGLVSIGDLVKRRIDRIEADAEAMRSYIQAG